MSVALGHQRAAFQAFKGAMLRGVCLDFGDAAHDGSRHGARDISLNLEYVAQSPVVPFSPDFAAGLTLHKVGGDTHLVAHNVRRTTKNELYPQAATNPGRIRIGQVELKRRSARHDHLSGGSNFCTRAVDGRLGRKGLKRRRKTCVSGGVARGRA